MNWYSLRTIIDDILLIVRNNNISESEDLSRDQIGSWVMAYKSYLIKKEQDKKEENGDDSCDDSLSKTIGPLKLQAEMSLDNGSHRKRTKDKLPELMGDSEKDLNSVCDETGCLIQRMSEARRHYHYFRRYTHAEPVWWYENGYIYVEGPDIQGLHEIYVEGTFTDDDANSEDDIKIPGRFIPDIKKAILDNELSFMLKRPSDDSNNSTLSSVKPHGPQDKEK